MNTYFVVYYWCEFFIKIMGDKCLSFKDVRSRCCVCLRRGFATANTVWRSYLSSVWDKGSAVNNF